MRRYSPILLSNQEAASNVAGWINDPSEHLIGSKISNFLSHWLTIITYRDGAYESIDFKEGIFEKRRSGPREPNESGTAVAWQPSEEFFTHTEVEIGKVKDLFNTVAALCPGLRIVLTENDKTTVYESKKGIHDLVDKAVAAKEIIKNRFEMKYAEGKTKMDVVMTYTSNYSSTIVPYVNTGLTEAGPHITQIKTALTREINKFFRDKKWLKEKDENLSGDDIQEGMYLVFNITAPNVAYDAQVKSRVTKIEMKPFVQALSAHLQEWMSANEKEIKKIADKALNARKAREAARKAKEAVRDTQKKKKEKVLKFDSKLADCFSRNRRLCEIFITEGK